MVQLKARTNMQREAPKEEVAEEDAEESQDDGQSVRAHRPHELSQRLIYERAYTCIRKGSPAAENGLGACSQ